MEERIGDLIDILSNKYEQTFQLESIDKNSSIMETTLINPIKLDSKRTYKASMLFFTTYNFIVNINETNNIFRYSHNSGNDWNVITLPIGSYEISQIDAEIKRNMKLNNHWDSKNNKFYIYSSMSIQPL